MLTDANLTRTQVFYLDNLEIEEWIMDHNVLPRIFCFTYERIQIMIAADTLLQQDLNSPPSFGKSKVRSSEMLDM